MAADDDYDGYLDLTAKKHKQRLGDALDDLEDRIANALDTAPTLDGKLFDLEWAVKTRSELQQIMNDSYDTEVTDLLRQYPDVSVKQLKMINQYGDFTKTSPEVIKNLQNLSFKGFEDIGKAHVDVMADELYKNTLTGRSKQDMVKSVRQSINGVYIKSDQSEINSLVEIAKNGSASAQAEAVSKLHSVYSSDRTGQNMRKYASQMTQDSLMQFDASLNTKIGRDAGIDTYKYYGNAMEDTRDFCRQHMGAVYTLEEIDLIWQGSWGGKSGSDGLINRGGYNCRHHFRPYIVETEGPVEEVYDNAVQEPIQDAELPTAAVSEKGMTTTLIAGADDARYLKRSDGKSMARFSHTRSGGDSADVDFIDKNAGVGKFGASPEMSDVLNEQLETVSKMAEFYNVPPIRALVVEKRAKYGASMGDGVLAWNTKHMSPIAYAARHTVDEIEDQIKRLRVARTKARQERSVFPTRKNDKLATAAEDELWDMQRSLEYATAPKPKTWTLGDDVKDRPQLVSMQLSDPYEKIQNTVFHEFGHHVHQQYGLFTRPRLADQVFYRPPIEAWIRTLTNKKYSSGYAKALPKDGQEWFAEGFAAYSSGRKDLVDKRLVELLDAFADKDYDRVDKIIKWGDYAE